jgi:Flp pilus assembly protein TadG
MSRQASLPKSAIWKAVRRFMIGAEGVSGAALVEFTVLAPMLLTFAIYTMDFGLIVYTKMEVQDAAQAGAQYAIVTNGYDATSISSAATNATKLTAVTITSSEFCGCPSTTAVTFCSASCNTCSTATCGVSAQGHYVTVTATPTTTYKPIIPFGLVPSSYTVSATSTVRIR